MSRIHKTNPLIWFTASNFHLAVLKKKFLQLPYPKPQDFSYHGISGKFQLPSPKAELSDTMV